MTPIFSTEDLHHAEQPVYSKKQNTNPLSARGEKHDDFASDDLNTNKKRIGVSKKNLILLMKLLILQFMFTMVVASDTTANLNPVVPPINPPVINQHVDAHQQNNDSFEKPIVTCAIHTLAIMIPFSVVTMCILALLHTTLFPIADQIALFLASSHFLCFWRVIYSHKDEITDPFLTFLLLGGFAFSFILFISNICALVFSCNKYKKEVYVDFSTCMLIFNTIIHFCLSIFFIGALVKYLYDNGCQMYPNPCCPF